MGDGLARGAGALRRLSVVATDAIYVAVDLLDDMDLLRQDMVSHLHGYGEELPFDLVRVTDYHERIALGELALVLQKLSHPRPHRRYCCWSTGFSAGSYHT